MKRFLAETLNAGLIVLGILSAGMGLKGFLLSSNFIDGGENLKPLGQYAKSLFIPDECTNQTHPRFSYLTQNLRLRRGRKGSWARQRVMEKWLAESRKELDSG